ncbi:SulP family inorganic anion transporter [Novosphingobium barchaimii]|nr:SulP family inorganic anion transporter [Novosphingobium barchaimii]
MIAGLSVAGLMLPEAVAYAGIAGLPPQRAVMAAIAGCLIYALIGRSRFAIVSPTSSSAAILAATLAVFPGSAAQKAVIATVAVALVGLFFLIAAGGRLGSLTGFVSRPVLRGFAFGLAITIILRQLPLIVGVPEEGSSIAAIAVNLIHTIPHWHVPSLITGGLALGALFLFRRWPSIPGAFCVLAGSILASTALSLCGQGVAVVGTIDTALQWPHWPGLRFRSLSQLAQLILPLVLILFAESWGTIRALALRHGDTVEPDRELLSLGLANVGAALVQGMPVGAGFSAGSAAEAAGAQSRWTAILASCSLAIIILVAAPAIASLPKPVLAAVVIAALSHALSLAPLVRLWRLDRDQYVALAAAMGVMAFGVLDGMLLAIALSIAALLHRLAAPHIVYLGQLGASHDYVDWSRHPGARPVPNMLIARPVVPIFFANADRVLAAVAKSAATASRVTMLVLSLEESPDMDSTALEALIDFDTAMAKRGVAVVYARLHDQLRDLLVKSGAGEIAERSHFSVDDAVNAALAASLGSGPP